MKVIIAGSRDILDYEAVMEAVVLSGFTITEVVSGTARGVDRLGEKYAFEFGVPVVKFPADWDRYHQAAGPIRNAEMGKYADAAIVVWDGESAGSRNMISVMHKLKKPCYVYNIAHMRNFNKWW